MDETEVPTGSVTEDMEEQIKIQSVTPMPDVLRPSTRIGIQSVAPKPGVLRPSPEIGFESVESMPREPFPSTPDDRGIISVEPILEEQIGIISVEPILEEQQIGIISVEPILEEQIGIASVQREPAVLLSVESRRREGRPFIGIRSVESRPEVRIGIQSVESMPHEVCPFIGIASVESMPVAVLSVESRRHDLWFYEHSIFRIPPGIRRANRNAFEPEIVSIGPYHDGNKVERLKAMQDYKGGYRSYFFHRNSWKGIDDYIEKIKSSIDRARKCYSEEVNMQDDDFTMLLLLDGSFIVMLLLMLWDNRHGRRSDPLDRILDARWMFGFLVGDLLKMENQVPFFVLQDLYNLSVAHPSAETPSITDLAYDFAKRVATSIFGEEVEIQKPSPEEEIQHLLHFCHSCFFAGRVKDSQHHDMTKRIPTARDLTKAGVKIKFQEKPGIWEVKFSGGVLEMTTAKFYNGTDIIFHNLIALEQCYRPAGVNMTGYSYFLDSLIHTSDDVSLLHQLGVIHNGLGSDEELAQVVNNLCHNVSGDLPKSITEMFNDVNEYCSHSWPTWRAMLVNDYFGNPWAIISLIAAVILLLLTVFQTVISTISYFQPPS